MSKNREPSVATRYRRAARTFHGACDNTRRRNQEGVAEYLDSVGRALIELGGLARVTANGPAALPSNRLLPHVVLCQLEQLAASAEDLLPFVRLALGRDPEWPAGAEHCPPDDADAVDGG